MDKEPQPGTDTAMSSDASKAPAAAGPEADWLPSERWAWSKILSDGVADFTTASAPDELRTPEIRGSFLSRLLLTEPYRSRLPPLGVQIIGARVTGPVSLAHARFAQPLRLERSQFEGDVVLTAVRASEDVSFRHSTFTSLLHMDGARIGGDLDLSEIGVAKDLCLDRVVVDDRLTLSKARCTEVSMAAARIRGRLELTSIHCTGPLKMNGMRVDGAALLGDAQLAGAELKRTWVGGHLYGDSVRCTQILDMEDVRVASTVFLRNARLHSLAINGASIDGQLALSGTCCDYSVNLEGIEVRADLISRNGFHCGSLELAGASIAGQVDMDELQCEGEANLEGIKVGADFYLRTARFGESLDLIDATIGEMLDLGGTHVEGTLDMERLECGANLFLRRGGRYRQVYLWDAQVRGTLEVGNAEFAEALDMTGIRAGYIWLSHGARFHKGLKVAHSKIEQNFQIAGSQFEGELDLTGVEIGAALIIGLPDSRVPSWCAGSTLILRDASIGTLRAASFWDPASWPEQMQLSGLTYQRIGIHNDESWLDTERGGDSLVAWLKRAAYHSQPYSQLAQVIRAQGLAEVADQILYAGQDRRRCCSRGLRRLGNEILRATIGYGIGSRYFRSLGWALGLTVLGAFIFFPAVSAHWPGRGASFLFSFDQLLPIIDVAPGADDIAKGFTGWRHWYLAVHRSLGFLLGSFVVAGLSGITQK